MASRPNQSRDLQAETPAQPAGSPAAGASGPPGQKAAGAQPQPLPPRADAGLLSLTTIAGHYRIAADPFQLSHDLGLGPPPTTREDIVRAGSRIGLKSRLLKGQKVERL